jgi:hypothetical protein
LHCAQVAVRILMQKWTPRISPGRPQICRLGFSHFVDALGWQGRGGHINRDLNNRIE